MKNILFAAISLFLFGSCEKTFLGPDMSKDPEAIFDELWTGFDENYALFSTTSVNWDEVYLTYRPQVHAETTIDELWEICTEMIKLLDDGHTTIIDYVQKRYENSGYGAEQIEADELFDLKLVQDNYLDGIDTTQDYHIGQGFLSGPINQLGYIFISGFGGDHPSDQFGAWTEEIEKVIFSFGAQVKGIIVDIRGNGGGTDSNSKRIAGAFADKEKLAYTKKTKNGPKHNAFDEPSEHFIQPIGQTYKGPIVLITDRGTVSAAEIFALLMKQNERVTHIGDTTWGGFSDVSFQRILPNGWTYQLSHQLYLDSNGNHLDGIGNIPDFFIKNTKDDLSKGQDLVLEKAITLLN